MPRLSLHPARGSIMLAFHEEYPLNSGRLAQAPQFSDTSTTSCWPPTRCCAWPFPPGRASSRSPSTAMSGSRRGLVDTALTLPAATVTDGSGSALNPGSGGCRRRRRICACGRRPPARARSNTGADHGRTARHPDAPPARPARSGAPDARGKRAWFEAPAYADFAAIADFSADRYAITTVRSPALPGRARRRCASSGRRASLS